LYLEEGPTVLIQEGDGHPTDPRRIPDGQNPTAKGLCLQSADGAQEEEGGKER